MSLFLETIQLRDGEFCRLGFHQARMNDAFSDIYPQAESIRLKECLHQQSYPKQGLYKCRVVYNSTIQLIEFVPYTPPVISTLKIVETDILSFPFKSADRKAFQNVFAQRANCDDVLLVKDGLLTDTSYCNIALWNGENWITPLQPLVYGVNRASLLNAGVLLEENISVNEIPNYSKIRLFNAMNEFGSIEMDISEAIIF